MTTFERAKKNILADMAACRVHTAESWANIMLKNTARLTKKEDQAKFWGFLTNPDEDEDIPMPTLERAEHYCIEKPTIVTTPLKITDDEKDGTREVEMENRYHREGFTMFIETKPRAETSMSMPLLADLGLSESPMDEQKEIEISSTPLEQVD